MIGPGHQCPGLFASDLRMTLRGNLNSRPMQSTTEPIMDLLYIVLQRMNTLPMASVSTPADRTLFFHVREYPAHGCL